MSNALRRLRRLASGRPAICVTLLLFASLLATIALYPASSPRAASVESNAADPNPGEVQDAPSFGTATPTEKFVQSFQQQVSQQLQSSLAQSSEAQESRFRSVEQQQREMDGHIQALEQSLAAVHASSSHPGQDPDGLNVAAMPGMDVEPPRVNVRKAISADVASGGLPGMGPGLIPALLSGQAGDGAMTGSGLNSASAQPAAQADGRPYSNLQSFTGYGRSSDANVAPHGFIEGRLLNGVVTQQGGPERESIVALTGEYQSANGYTADLDGCFALVQGRPEIATGRIDFKLSRLTCNFRDGASRTWDASGWLVDADGIRGVRATIVDNTGRKAAVAAGGGAIGGIGQRISQQQYEINGGPAGFAPSTSFAGNAGRDALGGAASGAANALGQSITDYYNLYGPSLQVGGGTHVTVVLANDLRLPYSGRDISQTHVARQ